MSANCEFCNQALTDEDIKKGVCPSCGATIGKGEAEKAAPVAAAPVEQTAETTAEETAGEELSFDEFMNGASDADFDSELAASDANSFAADVDQGFVSSFPDWALLPPTAKKKK